MSIACKCPHCKSLLRAAEALGGKAVTCAKCGKGLTIPLADQLVPPDRLLADATPEEMVQELYRRRKSAVLAFVNMTATGSSKSGMLDQSRVKCVSTDDLDSGQITSVFETLAKLSARQRVEQIAVDIDDEEDLFDLKGDRLGMRLEDFKKKHARQVPGLGKVMPWCSDESPGVRVSELMVEAWHHRAGIVHARLDLPAEDNSPPIAGVKTELVLYQFIDGRLFQIVAFFPTDGFHQIHEALLAKYGSPVSESHLPRQLTWWTMSATIELTFGKIRPVEPARLCFFHDALLRIARERAPQASQDI